MWGCLCILTFQASVPNLKDISIANTFRMDHKTKKYILYKSYILFTVRFRFILASVPNLKYSWGQLTYKHSNTYRMDHKIENTFYTYLIFYVPCARHFPFYPKRKKSVQTTPYPPPSSDTQLSTFQSPCLSAHKGTTCLFWDDILHWYHVWLPYIILLMIISILSVF